MMGDMSKSKRSLRGIDPEPSPDQMASAATRSVGRGIDPEPAFNEITSTVDMYATSGEEDVESSPVTEEEEESVSLLHDTRPILPSSERFSAKSPWVCKGLAFFTLFFVSGAILWRFLPSVPFRGIDGGGNVIVQVGPDAIHAKQIENYRAGQALMKNIHVTHHGGTFLCAEMKKWGPAPEFACMYNRFDYNETLQDILDEPWTGNDTDIAVPILRERFHFVSNEYRGTATGRPMYDTNWENEDLVSVFVTKHPIDRALSGDGKISGSYPPESERTPDDWWRFANEPRHTNNYALASLADLPGCCNGSDTNPLALENAKKLISRFTVVMDSACLSESIRELARLMGIENVTVRDAPSTHRPSRERLGNDTLYEYMLERNKLDVQMHEFAKSRSLVDCNKLVSKGESENETPQADPPKAAANAEQDNRPADGTANEVSSAGAPDVPGNIEQIHTHQIQNYKAGQALIKAVHVTHHGGTFLCSEMRKWGPAPEFACGVTQFEIDRLEPLKSNETIAELATREPWTTEGTDTIVPILREHFHFVTFEYRGAPTAPRNMYDTNWENEDLVSVYITKHPIDRALSGDGMIDYPPLSERTADDWWRFANEPRHTNNYALASLSDLPGCCNGADTNPLALENAKKLISRFTFVMDSACLSESIRELAKVMRIQNVTIPERRSKHPPSRERIGNDTLYDFLLERNKLDVQMHEFAQSRSLVDCTSL